MNDLPGPTTPPPNSVPVPDSWRIFRIMAEFVDGFELMASIGPAVGIFGSTNPTPKELKYYRLAEEIAKKIAAKGFGIITGGGPGIMECANKGAREGGGKSCGLCINLPLTQQSNAYIDTRYEINFRYFFVRKVMFVRYAKAFVILPGGYGTMDEFFEALTLIQTKKIKKFPVYLVGRDYYKGLLDWIRSTVLPQGNITKEDFDLIRLTDDPDEIANGIEEYHRDISHLENF